MGFLEGTGAPTAPATMGKARQALGPGVSLVGVIGSPVAHSLSPVLHAAAFGALGLGDRWRSFAFEIAPGQARGALAAMRRFDVTGLSVTMPHKAAVAGLVDRTDLTARRLEAVNCVHNRDGALFGTNTDGAGFIASLARGAGFDPAGHRCVVIGAGGAARAVVLALAGAGAVQVTVVNRTLERAMVASSLAGSAGAVVDAGNAEAVARAVEEADLVVNATPVGMSACDAAGGGEDWLVDPGLLRPGQVAADLVYAPRPTRWLAVAASADAVVLDGLGMLVHQAAAQIALWTGTEPPVEAMWEAVEASPPAP